MNDPKFIWSWITRNHHVARLEGYDGYPTCGVVRSQKNRRDGTKHDWHIDVLGSPVFPAINVDVRNLDACKIEAERQTLYTIERLAILAAVGRVPREPGKPAEPAPVDIEAEAANLRRVGADATHQSYLVPWDEVPVSERIRWRAVAQYVAEREDHLRTA